MKDFILQIDNVPEGDTIQVFNAPIGLTAKNILAIINKTTGKPVHSPIANAIASVSYGQVTKDRMFISLKAGHPAIAGNLLIKAYTDEEGGGGGIEIMTDAEYAPALSDLENMLDDIDVTDEN